VLKLFQEWGGDTGEWWRGEFKYDIFDILQDLLQMSQCIPTQHNNKNTEEKNHTIKQCFIIP
jgi:hypothetical protein